MNPSSGSVRNTLNIIVLLAVLPALCIIVYSSFALRARTLAEERAEAVNLVHNIALQKQQITENARTLLLSLSLMPEVLSLEPEKSKVIFQDILQKIPYYSNLTLVAPDGTPVAAAIPLPPSFSFSGNRDFRETLLSNKFAIGESTPDRATGHPVLDFAHPVLNGDGILNGILAGAIWSDQYHLELAKSDIPPESYLRLIDKNGRTFFSFPQELPSPETLKMEWENLKKHHRRQDSFQLTLPSGEEHTITYQNLFLPNTSSPYMTVALSVPESAILTDANMALGRDLFLMSVAALAAFAIAGLMGRRTIVRPVNQLLEGARRLGRGEFETRAHVPYLHGEVSRLARAFNEMGDALEARNHELVQAKNFSDADNRAKSKFLAAVSHEIRTPMNAVIGLAYLAMKTPLSDKQRKYFDHIYTAANALLGIINDILDFSKIESGDLHIEYVPFCLDDILDNLSALMSQQAEERELEFLFRVAPDVPDRLIGDPLRLGQILTNLVGNAIKFTEQGEIVITCERDDRTPLPEKASAEAWPEKNLQEVPPQILSGELPIEAKPPLPASRFKDTVRLRFTVQDSGIGITQEQLSRLFTAFTQADSSTTRRFGGTGLGLTITKHLLYLMDGDIQIDSEYGSGTTVTFTAAFGRGDSLSGESEADESEGDFTNQLPRFFGVRALVVDDNAVARQVLADQLHALCIDAIVAASAPRAFELLREAESEGAPFRLVFMDWRMPVMSGIDGIFHITNSLNLSSPPAVVLVTSFGRAEIVAQAERAGAVGILYKPVNKTVLQTTVENILFGRGAASSPGREPSGQGEARFKFRFPGKRILLVEDNPVNQEVAAELLRDAGISVTIAANGAEALNALETVGEDNAFDLVLMDLQMPGMDGYEATRRIRSHTRFDRLPVIAMTAHVMAEERQHCLAVGMNDHISKPIEIDKLFATLTLWLAPRPSEAEQPPRPPEAT